jgi:hypothetical protein
MRFSSVSVHIVGSPSSNSSPTAFVSRFGVQIRSRRHPSLSSPNASRRRFQVSSISSNPFIRQSQSRRRFQSPSSPSVFPSRGFGLQVRFQSSSSVSVSRCGSNLPHASSVCIGIPVPFPKSASRHPVSNHNLIGAQAQVPIVGSFRQQYRQHFISPRAHIGFGFGSYRHPKPTASRFGSSAAIQSFSPIVAFGVSLFGSNIPVPGSRRQQLSRFQDPSIHPHIDILAFPVRRPRHDVLPASKVDR